MRFFDDRIIEKIRKGFYSAVYFNRTKDILLKEKIFKKVTMQIFQKNEGSTLCGVEEVLELLKIGVGRWEGGNAGGTQSEDSKDRWIDKCDELKIESLQDGNRVASWETVMHITGPYVYFSHLESIYLGILARRTLLATNTKKAVKAAAGKSVIFFADRFDYFLNQEGDGYAAKIGGATSICTQAMSKGFGMLPVGTIPHSFIAVNDGDTVKTARQFAQNYPAVNLIVLVDFDNDCVRTSLEVARAMGKRLWGVRLDTAGNMVDKSLEMQNAKFKIQNDTVKFKNNKTKAKHYGVNPTLIRLVREALDKEGFKHVKIVVSGGFNEEKIKWFEKEKTPVDIYGVGSALVHGENDFTADIVKVEDKFIAKAGREYRQNNRLKRFV